MDVTEIYSAQKRIRSFIRSTPMERSDFLSELTGGEVYLKLENQQITGSFKIRGALNKFLKLSGDAKARGVVTASSGNHAQGVAYASILLGIESTIVVPENTPKVKIEAIRKYGVNPLIYGKEYLEAEKFARRIEKEEGKVFISAYNDLDVIAGQGTIAIEMFNENPDLNTVLVPVGGGGLISGIASYVKNAFGCEVLGVQSENSPVMFESLKQGKIVEMESKSSVAEALHGGIEDGSVTFEICRRLVDEIVLVKEESIINGIRLMIQTHHQVVEGGGAVGVAALLESPERYREKSIGIVISGGNLDEKILNMLIKA
ncbi:threonine/serine dehydratase [Candidatus Bathyarchaeota archaeon]|nr:threonine/serine dehydratase [Candidatus Bathyarchaeota archaeon]